MVQFQLLCKVHTSRRATELIARTIRAYGRAEMYQEPLRQMQHWEKPTAEVLKLNYDGSSIPGKKSDHGKRAC